MGTSDGILFDNTTPTTPVVTDEAAYTGSTSLSATWTSSSAPSGIAEYQYAIGTTAGGTNTRGWTSLNPVTATSISTGNLALTSGQTYYISVIAESNSGLWSSVASSDGITYDTSTASINISTTSNPANRGVHGAQQSFDGAELQQPQYYTNQNTDGLFSKWNYGFIRAACGDDVAWDANRTPYYKWCYSASGYDRRDPLGRVLGYDWYVNAAQSTNTTVGWLVNMNGNGDSYGRAVQDSGTTEFIQGAYDNGASGLGQPTESEKANWWNTNSSDSIFQRANDLATQLAGSGVNHFYEIGNEPDSGFRVPEAYWMLAGGNKTRRAWGGVYNDQFVNSSDCGRPTMLDWTSGSTGISGKILNMGFAYKPWYLNYTMNTKGEGGHLYGNTTARPMTPGRY